ncbi:MAG: prepilin peptidase [Patescibacteria group bacterium]|nr:prepilin peptidase [Patescibacteria group bacterium]
MIEALVFIFGLLVGSFLNVLIYRLNLNEEIISSRSHCLKCNHALAWYDLIPLFSWTFLKGRCRYCHFPISIQYPLVELATGVLFALIAAIYSSSMFSLGDWMGIVFYLFSVSVFIVVFVYDLKYRLIPNKVIVPAILVAVVYQAVASVMSSRNCFGILALEDQLLKQVPHDKDCLLSLLAPFGVNLLPGISVGAFFLLIIWLTRGRGMGGGDVKLGVFIGLLTGWPNVLVSLYLSFILGAVVSLGLIAIGKKKFGETIPFGPFLSAGALLTIFYGRQLFEWYFSGILGMR